MKSKITEKREFKAERGTNGTILCFLHSKLKQKSRAQMAVLLQSAFCLKLFKGISNRIKKEKRYEIINRNPRIIFPYIAAAAYSERRVGVKR
jgi:hypothetical protein